MGRNILSPDDYRNRRDIPVLPFCELEMSSFQWKERSLPQDLKTVGDHIRRRRLERELLQKDVANILQVSEDTITYWENNRTIPQIQLMPRIIRFLGYIPMAVDTQTLGGKIAMYRITRGLSYKRMGRLLGVDASTIAVWEENIHKPNGSKKRLLEKFFTELIKSDLHIQ